MSNGESVVSNASINQRAEVLDKAEKDAASKGADSGKGAEGDETAKAVAATKDVGDKTVVEDTAGKGTEVKPVLEDTSNKPVKKSANDPDEMRKWTTRTAQENAKLRKEMSELKEAQDKTFKLLSSISKKPVDYKELAKDPERLQKFIEDERENATSEMQERLDKLSTEAKQKDTIVERMRREHDTENFPEWKRLFPLIQKIALGPTGQGDPRVDFTKPASDVLDQLYEMALTESPAVVAAPIPVEKVYKESEMKTILAEMLAKEKDVIAKSAREEASKEAQEALSEEAKGGTVASAGKGAGRVPSDHLSAFKKMTLGQQRDWLISQQQNQ